MYSQILLYKILVMPFCILRKVLKFSFERLCGVSD